MNNPQFKNELSVPLTIPVNLSDKELKRWLLSKIELIDATKRSVTEQMSRHHNEIMAKHRDRNFYDWIRRAKAYKSHLTEERVRLRDIMMDVSNRIKKNRQIKNNKTRPSLQLAQVFMMVAEEILDSDLYYQIEQKALVVLES